MNEFYDCPDCDKAIRIGEACPQCNDIDIDPPDMYDILKDWKENREEEYNIIKAEADQELMESGYAKNL